MIAKALAGLLVWLLALAGGPAIAQPHCRDLTFESQDFAVCEARAGEDLRLFLNDAQGRPYGSFARIEAALAEHRQRLVFAMNGGMFHPDRRPVGLFVENHEQRARIVTRAGPGNFGMLPNGVFCVSEAGFSVIESRAFAQASPDCRFATQSGPMLVIDGALHPDFNASSQSMFIRNGVGVSDDGQRAVFVISDQPVTFHRFARVFRDALGLNNAIYIDGRVSRLYAPELERADWGVPLGPVVGLVAPRG